MVSSRTSKSIGIVWTTYHYYLGEIAKLCSGSQVKVTVYLYFHSAEEPPPVKGVVFRNVFDMSSRSVIEEIKLANHDSVVICGWHIELFRSLAEQLSIRVLLFIDNPWRHSLRQIAGSIYFRIFWLKNYDGVIVPGEPQKKFARFLGFTDKKIQTGFFSFLDLSLVTNLTQAPRREFIFIGRLIDWKGILELASAYGEYRSLVQDPWPLIVCGDGLLRSEIENQVGINVKGFLSKEDLFYELQIKRVFISCGVGEHWGISIYESAFFGHPLIVSTDAGAASSYLKDGINGIAIKGRLPNDILNALLKFHAMSDKQLSIYSIESTSLASLHDSDFFRTKIIPYILDES